VAVEACVVYVGITRQSMNSRLRYGFSAKGENGYHGYAWRHKRTQATLYVWAAQEDGSSLLDVETIEAEVVFLARHLTGTWPPCQTEIHFHQASDAHKAAAVAIWKAIP
jgi:hypothetical protein